MQILDDALIITIIFHTFSNKGYTEASIPIRQGCKQINTKLIKKNLRHKIYQLMTERYKQRKQDGPKQVYKASCCNT